MSPRWRRRRARRLWIIFWVAISLVVARAFATSARYPFEIFDRGAILLTFDFMRLRIAVDCDTPLPPPPQWSRRIGESAWDRFVPWAWKTGPWSSRRSRSTPASTSWSTYDLNVPFGLGGLIVAGIALRLLFLLPRRGRCEQCGYDLTGNTSGRCPECGHAVFPQTS